MTSPESRLATQPEFPDHTLYGRRAEQQQILERYHSVVAGRPGACMVEGISGIGKSALLAASRRAVHAGGALVISSRFAPPDTAPALHGLVRLLEDLTQQLLSLPPTHTLRRALLAAVGASSALFVDLAPSAVRLFGPQLAPRLTSPHDYRNSITLLFHQVIQALAAPAQPMAWFLDDCQWCDAASAEILRRLLLDAGVRHWCIFGAHRTIEGNQPPTFLQLALQSAQAEGAPITRLRLPPLDADAVQSLVSARLGADPTELGNLPDLLHARALGHPHYLIQAIDALVASGALARHPNTGAWTWSPNEIGQLPGDSGTLQLLQLRFHQLDTPARDLLALASHVGGPFTTEFLAALTKQPLDAVLAHLARAATVGLIEANVTLGEDGQTFSAAKFSSWRFTHDEALLAVQSLISARVARQMRQRVGAALLLDSSAPLDNVHMFLAASYLNESLEVAIGGATLDLPLPLPAAAARHQLAILNQNAAEQALRRLDATKARQFAQAGLAWLGGTDDPWTVDSRLAQDLATLHLRAAYFLGEQAEVEQWAERILPRTHDPAVMAGIYVILMMEATAREDHAAVDGLLHRGLAALQIKFPRRVGRGLLLWRFLRCRWLLRQSNIAPDQFALQLAQRSDENARYTAAARILLSAFLARQRQGDNHFVLLSALYGIEWTMHAGYLPLTVISFTIYTIMLASASATQNLVPYFTELILALLARLPDQQERAGVVVILNGMLLHRQQPLRATMAPLRAAIDLALADGDGQFAADCALVWLSHLQMANVNFREMIAEGEAIYAQLALCGDSAGLRLYRFQLDNCYTLAEGIDGSTALAPQDEELLDRLIKTGNRTSQYIFQNALLFRNLLAEDYPAARASAEQIRRLRAAITPGSLGEPSLLFGDSLAQLLDLSQTPHQRRTQLRRVAANQRSLAHWVSISPQNHRYRWLEVEALRYEAAGNSPAASVAFAEAWAAAEREEFVVDSPGIAELAARHHLRQGDFVQAQMWLERARTGYAHVGLTAKVRILERKFPCFASHSPEAAPKHEAQRTLHSHDGVLQALRRMQMGVTSEEMLRHTLAVLMDASRSRRVTLFSGSTTVHAKLLGQQDGTQVALWPQGLSLGEQPEGESLPLQVLRFVLQGQTPLLVNGHDRSSPFALDASLVARGVSAYWCLPITLQGRLVGAVYLEEPAAVGDPEQHIEAIRVMAADALLLWENEQLRGSMLGANVRRTASTESESQGDLRVRLLGQCSVMQQGEDLVPRLSERMLMLLALVVLQNGSVPRGWLSEALWPETTDKQSQTNLRNLIFKLRQAWPESADLIDFDQKTLSWKPGVMIEADVTAFARAVEIGLNRSDLTGQRALEQAVVLYEGDLLPGRDLEALQAPREQLRMQHLAVLERLIELHIEQGEWGQALRYAQQVQATEPMREASYHPLIRLYALLGDGAAARRAYAACLAMLHDEYGAPPSALTELIAAQYLTE